MDQDAAVQKEKQKEGEGTKTSGLRDRIDRDGQARDAGKNEG